MIPALPGNGSQKKWIDATCGGLNVFCKKVRRQMLFGHDLTFWLAVLGATVLKLFTSPYHSMRRAVATVFAAVFCAYFFTEPVMHYLEIDPEHYGNAVAALLALTGEGIVRLLIQIINDPAKAGEWLKALRSGK